LARLVPPAAAQDIDHASAVHEIAGDQRFDGLPVVLAVWCAGRKVF